MYIRHSTLVLKKAVESGPAKEKDKQIRPLVSANVNNSLNGVSWQEEKKHFNQLKIKDKK